MNGDERTPVTFSLARRWGAWLNLAITLAAVLGIVAMVNYLGMRHFVRATWARNSDTELSPRTLQVLASLTNDVKIITYFDSEDSLFPRVRALLREYENAGKGRITVEHVDYVRQPARANVVRTTYNLSDADRDAVVFDGVRQSIVRGTALSDYDTSELMSGKSRDVYRTHFKGEMLFTSKIYESSGTRSPKAYFLYGNGEHSPAEAAGAQGYSKFAAILQNENNFQLQALDLVTQKQVPADCSLLVIAGPVQTISEEESERIGRYLDSGGRLLVLFNHRNVQSGRPTGLEKLLVSWGIEIGRNMVLDPENSSSANGMAPKPVKLGSHPIVNSLGSSRVHLILPRSVRAAQSSARRREETAVEELLFTGPKTITVQSIPPRAQPEQTGSLPLAVAVDRSIPAVDRGATRIVAIGDSSFWSNEFIEFDANSEFASLAVNWLVQQNILLNEIPRRAIGSHKLSMTQSQLRTAQLLLLVVMPLAVLGVGSVVWMRRRK